MNDEMSIPFSCIFLVKCIIYMQNKYRRYTSYKCNYKCKCNVNINVKCKCKCNYNIHNYIIKIYYGIYAKNKLLQITRRK